MSEVPPPDPRDPAADGPPRALRRLLNLLLAPGASHVMDELEELWRARVARVGRAAADRWYRRQALSFLLRAGRFARRYQTGRHAGTAFLDAFSADLRIALRQLWRRPAAALLPLAILSGAVASSTLVFSVVDGVLLGPLPYPEPDRLVQVTQVEPTGGAQLPISPPAYLLWSERTPSAIIALSAVSLGGADLMDEGEPEHLATASVGHSFFDVMDVAPARGRGFTAAEDALGGARVVILSHRLWTRRFSRDPRVLGRALRLGGEPHVVVGIMPAGFDYPAGTDAWLPLRPALGGMEDVWGAAFLEAVARLGPGALPEEARIQLKEVLAGVADGEQWEVGVHPLAARMTEGVRGPLLMLLGAVGLVLLAACANVGGLFLSRTLGRKREFEVRAAVGAGRARLARALLAESLLISGAAGALGVLVCFLALERLTSLAPIDLPRGSEIRLDGRSLAFAVAATLLTGLIAGALPAIRLLRARLSTLREGEGQTGDRGTQRLRLLLVTGQMAVMVLLLSGAALLGRSFLQLISQPMGFDGRNLAAVELELPAHRYPDDHALVKAYQALGAAAAAVPGVEAAAVTRNLPLAGRRFGAPVRRPETEQSVGTVHVSATPGYLELLRASLLRGRTFTEADVREGRRAVVVSESFARRLFADENPLGHTVVTMFGSEALEIVGVVRDVRHASPGQEPGPMLYRPLDHWTSRGVHVVVRSSRPAAELLPALREAVRRVDPELAVIEMTTLETLLSRTVARPRFYTLLLGGFAVFSVLLSMAGLHALLASLVTSRRREIGIRMAIGADRTRVRRWVARQVLALSASGLAVGLALAFALRPLLEGLLFQVGVADLPALALVLALTLLTSAVTAYPHVRRAVAVDPAEVLRS